MNNSEDEPTEEHDGSQFIDDLQKNLSQQDKPIAFLFGAGTSCAVQVDAPAKDREGAGTSCAVQVDDPDKDRKKNSLIPDILELTNICREKVKELGDEYEKAWEKIEEKNFEKKNPSNVEYMLSRLALMLEVLENSENEERLAGLDAEKMKKMENKIRETIAVNANPNEDKIPKELPHNKFAQWLINVKREHPIEIFTVNYDTLIERALAAERVPVFDGFVGSHKPFFYPESLRYEECSPGNNWTRLWKIHGSISWERENRGRYVRIIRKEVNNSSGERKEVNNFPGEMILPSLRKYDDVRQQPYVSFLDKLKEFLNKDNSLLITIGFSFRDSHINKLIFDGLKNKPTTNIYSLQYEDEDLKNKSILYVRSKERKNMTVIYPKSIIVSGKHKKLNWDSNEKFSHIVDFNVFCDFIETIISSKKDESSEIEPHEVTAR